MKIVRKIEGNKRETTIEHEWIAPGGTARVSMTEDDHNDGGANFEMSIDGGQVEFIEGGINNRNNKIGSLHIWGGWERECFIELLEQIIIELKLIDQK